MSCTSVIVGKEMSVDGSVSISKAEDISGDTAQQLEIIPRKYDESGEGLVLQSGRKIPQAPMTHRAIQFNSNYAHLTVSRYDYNAFNPNYFNEWQVFTGDNAGKVREENKAEFPDQGIYAAEIKTLIGQRAKTAREGVKIVGNYIDQFGFGKTGAGSRKADGAMYVVADPNEAWLMEVATGKHWVAQRCPDNAIMMRANCFRIGEVNLNDPDHFMGSKDLITYATAMGWYDPPTDGPFNFSKAYGNAESLVDPFNTLRELHALQYFASSLDFIGPEQVDQYPESMIFKPDRKVSKEDLMGFMRSHYEGTPFDKTEGYKRSSPHYVDYRTICVPHTQSCAIVQLRNWLPNDIGGCLWVAQGCPCTSVFVPWYLGINDSPGVYQGAIDKYDEGKTWWRFKLLGILASIDYKELSPKIRLAWESQEKQEIDLQVAIEKTAIELYEQDPAKARAFLTRHSGGWGSVAHEKAGELISECIRRLAELGK